MPPTSWSALISSPVWRAAAARNGASGSWEARATRDGLSSSSRTRRRTRAGCANVHATIAEVNSGLSATSRISSPAMSASTAA